MLLLNKNNLNNIYNRKIKKQEPLLIKQISNIRQKEQNEEKNHLNENLDNLEMQNDQRDSTKLNFVELFDEKSTLQNQIYPDIRKGEIKETELRNSDDDPNYKPNFLTNIPKLELNSTFNSNNNLKDNLPTFSNREIKFSHNINKYSLNHNIRNDCNFYSNYKNNKKFSKNIELENSIVPEKKFISSSSFFRQKQNSTKNNIEENFKPNFDFKNFQNTNNYNLEDFVNSENVKFKNQSQNVNKDSIYDNNERSLLKNQTDVGNNDNDIGMHKIIKERGRLLPSSNKDQNNKIEKVPEFPEFSSQKDSNIYISQNKSNLINILNRSQLSKVSNNQYKQNQNLKQKQKQNEIYSQLTIYPWNKTIATNIEKNYNLQIDSNPHDIEEPVE